MPVQRTDVEVYENGAVHIGREFAGLTVSRVEVEFEELPVDDAVVEKYHCPACDFTAETRDSVQAHLRKKHPQYIDTDD